jgi:hypothetical protein
MVRVPVRCVVPVFTATE